MSVPGLYSFTMSFLPGNVILIKMLVFDSVNTHKSLFLILRTNLLVGRSGNDCGKKW